MQYTCRICAKLYLFAQCAIYVQDCTYFLNVQYMCKSFGKIALDCTSFSNAQYMCKIVLISPMRNICTRFAQDCTYFSNTQYMHKISARLYFFPQCTIYAQDCTYFLNAQYMCKICTRLMYFILQCAIYGWNGLADLGVVLKKFEKETILMNLCYLKRHHPAQSE